MKSILLAVDRVSTCSIHQKAVEILAFDKKKRMYESEHPLFE